METITLLISQAAQLKWKFYQMGVTSMFSYGVIEEKVYVKKPPRFMKAGRETQVLNLSKALYCLKLAPQAWITRISSYLKKNGYCNETYAKETIKRFNMAECHPMATPMAPGTKFSKFREEIKWMRKSRMELYMQYREHGRMILESIKHGPLIWPMIEENGVTRIKKYEELSATEKIQADCDLKETNIILQGLPSEVYSLVNHHRVAKDLWERVQLLMQGTSLTKQERECKLYDAFDKFSHIKGESLHQYYLRFTQLINDMNIYKMKLEQFQVNTKFLNNLPPEWSKFVTDVKLVRDLHTTNFDQLHAYLKQHELHANEVCIMRERNQDPLALGRQSSFAASTFGIRANISGTGGNNSGQQRVVKCFNCQREGSGKVLNEEELEFLADPRVAEAKAVLMANLSSYRSYVLSEVPHSENTHNDMLNQSVQDIPYSEQTHLVNYPENEITSDSNIIPYSLLETQNAALYKFFCTTRCHDIICV
ncbi:retrovirus-related pol polyprotein from transposon TNT 1-94 [Tanacetum coccineum]